MAKLNRLLTDPKKDVEGSRMHYMHDVVFLVARWGNHLFEQEQQRRLLQMAPWERRAGMEDEASRRVLLEATQVAVGKHILVGWENLEDADGKPIEYSPEYSVKLCRDPSFRAVYNDIVAFSMQPSNYRDDAVDDIAGNSQGSSLGDESGDPS